MTKADVARVADAMATVYATHSADTTVDELRAFFSDDHVHMAVVVDRLGFLVTTIERAELEGRPGRLVARQIGTLEGRVVRSADALRPVTDRLRRERRRRMAVFRFMTSPSEVLGDRTVAGVRVVRNELRDGRAVPRPTAPIWRPGSCCTRSGIGDARWRVCRSTRPPAPFRTPKAGSGPERM
jgi:hypothetical protein